MYGAYRVSDNGPTFTSDKFRNFLKNNGITQILTAPYYPSSNGAAENAVKFFKNKFKLLTVRMSRREALTKYLFAVRSSVHGTTGVTPAELQIGRKLRTRLDLCRPSVREFVLLNQERQKRYYRGKRVVTAYYWWGRYGRIGNTNQRTATGNERSKGCNEHQG